MFGLKFKVILSTAVAAISVGGYFAAEYYGSMERVEAAARQGLMDSTERSAQKVEDWMDANRGGLETLGATPNLLALSMSEKPEEKARAKARMQLGIEQLPWVRASYLTEETGMQVIRSNDEKLVKIGDRTYWKQARFGVLGHQLVISRTTFRPTLALSKSINDKDGKFAGTVSYTVNVGTISDQVVKDKVGKTGFKFMLDEDGNLVAHANKNLAELRNEVLPVYTTHPLWRVRPSGAEVATLEFEHEGEKFMGSIAKAGFFYVAAVLPRAEIDEPLAKQRQDAGLWFGAALLLSMGLALVIASVLAKPLRKLTEAAEGISMGQFDDEKIDSITSKDEIGKLAKAIKQLSQSVKISMKQLSDSAKK